MRYLECGHCKWIAEAVSRAFAIAQIDEFNTFFVTLSEEERNEYYQNRRAGLHLYDTCMKCGASHTEAHILTDLSHVPIGSTIGYMIAPDDV